MITYPTNLNAAINNDARLVNLFGNADIIVTMPLPLIGRDSEEFAQFIEQYKIIPKFRLANSTAQTMVSALELIFNRSHTHATCLNAIQNYGFDGDLKVKYNRFAGFDQDNVEMQKADKDAFILALQGLGITAQQITKITKELYRSFKEFGDAYVKAKVVRVGNVVKCHLNLVKPSEFVYVANGLRNESGYPATGLWSKDFLTAMASQKLDHVGVTQLDSEEAIWSDYNDTGAYETIFHLKNSDDSDLYGSMPSESILMSVFSEYQLGKFAVKADQNLLTGKYIFAQGKPPVGGLNEEQGKRNDRAQLENVLSVKSTRSSEFALMDYVKEFGEPKMFKLDAEKDINWFLGKNNWARENIWSHFQLNGNFLGFVESRQGIGQNAEINNLIKVNAQVIEPTQRFFEAVWSRIFTKIGDLTQIEILKTSTIQFADNITPILDMLNTNIRGNKVDQSATPATPATAEATPRVATETMAI